MSNSCNSSFSLPVYAVHTRTYKWLCSWIYTCYGVASIHFCSGHFSIASVIFFSDDLFYAVMKYFMCFQVTKLFISFTCVLVSSVARGQLHSNFPYFLSMFHCQMTTLLHSEFHIYICSKNSHCICQSPSLFFITSIELQLIHKKNDDLSPFLSFCSKDKSILEWRKGEKKNRPIMKRYRTCWEMEKIGNLKENIQDWPECLSIKSNEKFSKQLLWDWNNAQK